MLIQDLRYGLRMLRRRPTVTAAAILTLALGIGAGVAIFSIVDALLLRPLPYPEPERLVALWEESPARGWHMDFVAPANLLDWEAQATGFEDMAAYHWGTEEQILLAAGEPRRVQVLRVTAELFTVLGVRPLHGATFRPAETWQGSELSVVLSHGLWQRHFGADPAVVGRTIRVHGESRTVRGVMPPGFAFPDAGVDLWVPYGWDPEVRLAVEFRRHHYLRAVARLRPGVRAAEAAAELAAIARRLEAAHPLTNETMGAGLTPLHDWVVGETRTPLLVLSGAVIMVLAVACANVVNLLWVRFGARVREMAVRSVLGARRSRLVGQLLSECLLLALGAGALGLLLGHWGLRLLLVLSPQELPRLGEVGVDLRGVGFSLAVVLAATVACGLAPALSGSRLELQPALREGTRGPAAGRGQRRTRDLLVVAEVAVALVLVLGSGLLLRSFRQLCQVEPGFDPTGLLAVRLTPPPASYPTEEEVAVLFERLRSEVAALPGVAAVADAAYQPFAGDYWTSVFAIAGRDRVAYGAEPYNQEIGRGYFRTVGLPLRRGRAFTTADHAAAPRVIIVNETLARRHFPDQDPLGQRLALDREPDADSLWYTIVGVVADSRLDGFAKPVPPAIYHPLTQEFRRERFLLVRSQIDAAGLVGEIRELVSSVDPSLPLMRVVTIPEVMAGSLARERFLMVLLGVFAAVALVLAAIGTYGVMAAAVNERVPEIAVRMALGATAGGVVRQVMAEGMRKVLVGFAVGLGAAWLLRRSLEALLFEIRAVDPGTTAVASAVLLGTGFLACYLPTRRASRVDPTTALRCE